MADNDETQETPAPAPEPTPTPTPPQFVAADEFRAFQAVITGTLNTIQESIQAQRSAQVHEAPRPEVQVEDASDAEIEQALQTGTGASTFRKLLAASEAKLRKELNTRAGAIENTAGSSLADIATRVSKPLMKHYDKPFIRKEVDALIAQMPVESRVNPNNHLIIYNAVVGQHADELIAESVEAALRAGKTPGVKPGDTSSRNNAGPNKTTIKDVFGENSERELRAMGRDLDRVAKGLGFKDADEYIKYAQAEGEGFVQ